MRISDCEATDPSVLNHSDWVGCLPCLRTRDRSIQDYDAVKEVN